MKRRLPANFMIVTVLSMILCMGVSADDYSSRLYYVSKLPAGTSITVDGNVDPIWENVAPQPITRYDDMGYEYTETVGTLRIVWNDEGFYALVEVDKKGEPVYTECEKPGFLSSYESIDCVQLSFCTNQDFMSWGHAGATDVAYTGGACPDFDGGKNLLGWFNSYGTDKCDAAAKKTADDKYVAEFFFSWVSPNRTDVYGSPVHGGTNGDPGSCTLIMLDVSIHVQTDDGTGKVGGTSDGHTSVISWNMYPYNSCSLENYGYVLLTNDTVDAVPAAKGDCNADSVIDVKDVTLLLKHLAEWEDTGINIDAADCSGDGDIDMKDVTLLLKYLAEWEDITLG